MGQSFATDAKSKKRRVGGFSFYEQCAEFARDAAKWIHAQLGLTTQQETMMRLDVIGMPAPSEIAARQPARQRGDRGHDEQQ